MALLGAGFALCTSAHADETGGGDPPTCAPMAAWETGHLEPQGGGKFICVIDAVHGLWQPGPYLASEAPILPSGNGHDRYMFPGWCREFTTLGETPDADLCVVNGWDPCEPPDPAPTPSQDPIVVTDFSSSMAPITVDPGTLTSCSKPFDQYTMLYLAGGPDPNGFVAATLQDQETSCPGAQATTASDGTRYQSLNVTVLPIVVVYEIVLEEASSSGAATASSDASGWSAGASANPSSSVGPTPPIYNPDPVPVSGLTATGTGDADLSGRLLLTSPSEPGATGDISVHLHGDFSLATSASANIGGDLYIEGGGTAGASGSASALVSMFGGSFIMESDAVVDIAEIPPLSHSESDSDTWTFISTPALSINSGSGPVFSMSCSVDGTAVAEAAGPSSPPIPSTISASAGATASASTSFALGYFEILPQCP
jgi:hypothetical protein